MKTLFGTGDYIVDETPTMLRAQRIAEQEGHRRLGAKVHARNHEQIVNNPAPEGELQNAIEQHPDPKTQTQRFDGATPSLNSMPALNSTARTEFDNERREQEKEKQNRLEHDLNNKPSYSTAPRPG